MTLFLSSLEALMLVYTELLASTQHPPCPHHIPPSPGVSPMPLAGGLSRSLLMVTDSHWLIVPVASCSLGVAYVYLPFSDKGDLGRSDGLHPLTTLHNALVEAPRRSECMDGAQLPGKLLTIFLPLPSWPQGPLLCSTSCPGESLHVAKQHRLPPLDPLLSRAW